MVYAPNLMGICLICQMTPLLPKLGKVSPCNCTATRKASRRLSQMYDGALVSSGLKSTQYSIIAEIYRRGHEPLTVSELAEAMVMDRSTLGHNLRPLERDKLIALQSTESDRRTKRVVLTGKGQARFAEAYVLWRRAQDRFEQRFGTKEAADLRAVLLSIAADSSLAYSLRALPSELAGKRADD
jgi:DNA-binding MarR family transcriptional regulator